MLQLFPLQTCVSIFTSILSAFLWWTISLVNTGCFSKWGMLLNMAIFLFFLCCITRQPALLYLEIWKQLHHPCQPFCRDTTAEEVLKWHNARPFWKTRTNVPEVNTYKWGCSTFWVPKSTFGFKGTLWAEYFFPQNENYISLTWPASGSVCLPPFEELNSGQTASYFLLICGHFFFCSIWDSYNVYFVFKILCHCLSLRWTWEKVMVFWWKAQGRTPGLASWLYHHWQPHLGKANSSPCLSVSYLRNGNNAYLSELLWDFNEIMHQKLYNAI